MNRKRGTALFRLLWLGISVFAAYEAQARVGGGGSYSGGHSSGGGYSSGGGGFTGGSGGYSSGGGGGGIVFLFEIVFRLLGGLVQLTIAHPLIGIPIDLLLLVIAWQMFGVTRTQGYRIAGVKGDNGSEDLREDHTLLLRNAQVSLARNRLRELRAKLDPAFSQILLMDFLHSLYSVIHHARGENKLTAYAGYLSPEATRALLKLSPGLRAVSAVIIGSAAVIEVSTVRGDQPMVIHIAFETNYTETAASGQMQTWYSRELWRMSRKADVRSREPDRIRLIACPACGAPPASDGHGICPACGTQVSSGAFDWYVDAITTEREQRPPQLTSTVEEQAGSLPTLVDPGFAGARNEFMRQNPDFDWDRFSERAALIFTQLQQAWTQRKWEIVRPFESDNLFESHSYWIAEYRRQKLINVLKDIRLEQLVPVKIEQDQFFSAITLRVFASMIDCTQTETGTLLSGSAKNAREFTEYWTFIRGRSAKPPKTGVTDLNCPACGAELMINRAGHCEYCEAKITSGDFDWVLSSIEQDESYAG